MDIEILNEITGACETCVCRERCREEDCVLFRIESIITQTSDSGETSKK